jgi:hypothetical protein
VAGAALAAIRTAAAKSGLVDKPAHATETPMVGGGLTGGLVDVGRQKVELLSQPAPADLEGVGPVLAATPPRFDHFTDPD